MSQEFKFRIAPDGGIDTIYSDALVPLVKDMGGEITQICRASTVEYETVVNTWGEELKGWVVRSAHNPELAIRIGDDGRRQVGLYNDFIVFPTREEALAEEVKHFFALRPQKEQDHG
jgi:hypothetical protein